MSREQVLRAVKDAEKKADEHKAKAESDAAAIVSQARADASALIAEGRDQVDVETNDMVESARAKAVKATAKVEKSGAKELDAIREGGEARRSDAVDAVLESFRA